MENQRTKEVNVYNIYRMSFVEKSYPLFLYLGIFFFIVHILIYGLSLDLSYFGLFLIAVGYFKISLYSWMFYIVWILVGFEFINLGKKVYDLFFSEKKGKKKREKNKN